jgi:integrase
MPHLTDTLVKNLPIPITKKALTPDGDTKREPGLRRFFAQVTRDGCRSFVIRYSINRRERLFTIGRWPDWPTAAARDEARRLLQLVDQGIDPLEKRINDREAPTVKDLARRFLDEHVPTKRSSYRRNNEILLDKWILPALGGLKVGSVEQRHIGELHHKITRAGSPIMANRAISCASKMFSLAIRWGWRSDNPCKHAVDRNVENQRRRYLKPEEIARLSDALAAHSSQQAADCIRLIMLTGCRRGEALAAHLGQIDLDTRMWKKPPASVKQGDWHEFPLQGAALELVTRLVEEARKNGREYLFPDRSGSGHLTDLKRSWTSICGAAGLQDVRLHDLRHSFASIAVSRGATLPLVGSLLGHSAPSTTARYSHLLDSVQRALAETVGAAITGNDGGDVVPLRRRP